MERWKTKAKRISLGQEKVATGNWRKCKWQTEKEKNLRSRSSESSFPITKCQFIDPESDWGWGTRWRISWIGIRIRSCITRVTRKWEGLTREWSSGSIVCKDVQGCWNWRFVEALEIFEPNSVLEEHLSCSQLYSSSDQGQKLAKLHTSSRF